MLKRDCTCVKAGHDSNIPRGLPVPSPSMPGMSSPNLGEKRAGEGEFGPAAALRPQPGKSCGRAAAGEKQLQAGELKAAAQGEASWVLAQGKTVPQKPSLAVGSHRTGTVSFLSKTPLPFYSFFRGLALELPCLSLLELGRPLAWCGGTSWSISSAEVGGWVLTHPWAAVCGRRAPLSDPSVCKITARTDNALLIASRYQ